MANNAEKVLKELGYWDATKKSSQKEIAEDNNSFRQSIRDMEAKRVAANKAMASTFKVGDIAPVRTTTSTGKKKKKDKKFEFFQSGAFEDGYQFGDIGLTVGSTIGDATINAAKGVGNMVEGIVDLGAYGIAGMIDLSNKLVGGDGKTETAADMRKRYQKNVVDDILAPIDEALNENSILGRTSDSVMQGLGQIGAVILTGGAAGAAGMSATAATTGTMFLSGAGGGMTEAYQSGATDLQALKHGLNTGAADAVSELIFGGLGKGFKALGFSKGLSSADDMLAKLAGSKFKNQAAKNIVEFGIKSGAEGLEEVLAGVAQAYSKYHNYLKEDGVEFIDVLKDENLLEQFLVGTFASGVAQSSSLVRANTNKNEVTGETEATDFITGFTETEQAVIDKEVEKLIAEQEKDGRKLTKKEKQTITEQVEEGLDKGYISIDTIAEVMEGDMYTKYKTDSDNEAKLRTEYNELYNMKYGDKSSKQFDREAELKSILESSKLSDQRTELHTKAFERIKGGRLTASYAEETRKYQKFTADTSKYSEKQAAMVQRAIDSGVLNNTNRSHEFVDTLAKIEEGKGLTIHLTNNKQLRESGRLKEGATTNGWVDDNGNLVVNVDAAKALNSVVGHELTHTFENTEFYDKLQKTAFTHATERGEYDSRLEAIKELYEKHDAKADHKKELTADLVGDYCFTDEKFIERLLNDDRSTFSKVMDEIKYLARVATAGSKEARELEKVKHQFEKAWKNSGKAKVEGTKNSLGYHAGDLGKAESWAKQSASRGTGHFGTGTYFVGDEAKISGNDVYGRRPHHSIDFDKYNLFRPRNTDDGYKVHSLLREIDGGNFTQEMLDAAIDFKFELSNIKQQAWDRRDEYDERVWDDDIFDYISNDYIGSSIRADYEVAQENELEVQSFDEWLAEETDNPSALSDYDYEDYKYYYLEYLEDTIKEADAKLNEDYDDFRKLYRDLQSIFGYSKKTDNAFHAVIEHKTKMQEADLDVRSVADSNATVFMKALGYEGIDVRGIDGLDNTTYGSVIYDLKGEDAEKKAAIGTAKYSLSDTNGRQLTSELDGERIDPARFSVNETDTQYSLSFATDIAEGQNKWIAKNQSKAFVDAEELAEAQRVTAAMVDVMMKYSNILPEDKIGKVITKNGSYDRSIENTTICVRTLAYNEFVDKVQEQLGRPLTQMESFLVSQKLYDIATEPQCLYCYVSLDRKAYNDMLLRYMSDRDEVIAKYNSSDKSSAAIEALYEEFLHGRKPTKEMRSRFNNWIGYVDNGTQLLSLADIATEASQANINALGGDLAAQLKDARKYAQSASWAKIQKDYVAYRDEILKLGDKVVKDLNSHYGMRWYSFSDFSAAFIVENMQQITDASIRGLKGLSYTKDTDFAEIFAPTGMNINISVFVNQDADGNFFIDEKQSASFEDAKRLREQYPNVGIVATVTNDDALRWAASQEWSDVIIPFHIVRTGTDVAEYYKWLNYTSESGDTVSDKSLWDAYVDSLNPKSESARKKVSKNIYPNEHKNDKTTYLTLCENRGLTPRFARFAGESWYMKLVNETRLSSEQSVPLRPIFNEDAAKASFDKFVKKGGYEGGWYLDGVDVDAEAAIVADDVRAGRKANEVEYGRQDGFVPEAIMARRKKVRTHGRYSLSEDAAPVYGSYNIRGRDVAYSEDIAPVDDGLVYGNETADVDVMQDAEELFPDDMSPMSDEYEADRMNSLFYEEAPPEVARENDTLADTVVLPKKHEDFITKTVRDSLALKNNQIADLRSIIREYAEDEYMTRDGLYGKVKNKFGFFTEQTGVVDEGLKAAKQRLRDTRIFVSDTIKGDIADYGKWKRSKFGKIRFSNEGLPVDIAYQELSDDMPEYFPDYITNPTDQLIYMADFMDYDENLTETREIGDDTIWNVVNDIAEYIDDFKEIRKTANADKLDKESFDSLVADGDTYAPPVSEDFGDDFAPVAQQTPVETQQTSMEAPVAETDNEYKQAVERINKKLVEDKMQATREYKQAKEALADRNAFISNRAKELYDELRALKKGVRASNELSFLLDFGYEWSEVRGGLINVYRSPDRALNENHAFEPIAREAIGREYEARLEDLDFEYNERISQLDAEAKAKRDAVKKEAQTPTRKEYHQRIIDGVKATFKKKGFDFDEVLKGAKNLSTFATVDNTPQRVMEKALGYKEGGILADITVNKVAQNETEGIKWLNSYVDQLKQISKEYRIKPGSKESAAAQMYAEGFYVNDKNEVVAYGDNELAQDFKNPDVQRRIKALAGDSRIRQIYDDTLANINESRKRNLYPEIQKLDNYFLHFRAMEDTFSTLGLPFNPNDIRAKDLPTDLNGVTADLKPGQPYFASAMHRKGQRTSFDLLGGVERYLNSAKNQIYHIDDIQTLRALRNYIAETYGQATGLEDIDSMTDAEAEERIKQVYGSHLSTFAKFLNEEANVLAGKTALIDRGIEGVIGRRGMTFLDTLNKQVGSNMVGYNISSSLTNFLPVAQAFAKTNKFDFTKAFAQTAANKLSGGKFDSFKEDSPVVIRRKGSDRFYRTAWQKMADPGYALMGIVDDISTELIARTKYNELTRKGMDSQKAHFETDKWVSRLMGDRSLGQQPQIFNSKMLGIVTKFQLEVRNQLDAQFYDTIQETKVSNEHIQNELARNAKTAAKVASVFTQLAVVQHLYGTAFETVAGYNPAFDIIGVLATAFGFDDEEDDEDTIKDNLEQGFEELVEDLPYASIITGGGRIPISSALPIKEFFKGEDQYGNEKSRWETLGEVAPYYLMPGGYGQLKKTAQGLNMFSDEHPIAGSYTDAGNLRFNVEDTVGNRIKAGIFGQYASENARKYFDQEQRTLNPEQTAIFAGLDIPIEEYWEYRDKYNEFKDTRSQLMDAAFADGATDEDQLKGWYVDAINDEIYDLYEQQKEVVSGNSKNKKTELRKLQSKMEKLLSDSQKAMDNIYINGYYAEVGDKRYDYSTYSGGWYEISGEYLEREENAVKRYGITPEEYWNDTDLYYHADWYFDDKYASANREAVANLVFGGKRFAPYAADLGQIKGEDKNGDGRTDSGSKKKKIVNYINNLNNLDYGEKIIMLKMSYTSDDNYNYDIIDYLNNRSDISYSEMVTILESLDMKVSADGTVTWK